MQFDQLGPYRLGKKLGQGGMGAVYEGVDVETGDAAAIKVLSPRLAVDDCFRVRFEAEIDSLKKLRHPNIVRLFGYGEQGGTLFYAMELVPGTSLEDELRAGRRFEWREVTQLAIKLCRALKHAHDHGVIHRDLKPANLLMTPDGDIKLSDFGIARLFGNTRMTADGGVLGTAEFMAPEQADGRAGDRQVRPVQPGRRDVHAVGRAAAVSRKHAGRDVANAALCRPRAGHAFCPRNAGRIGPHHSSTARKGPAAAVCQHADAGPQPGGDGTWAVGFDEPARRRLRHHAARRDRRRAGETIRWLRRFRRRSSSRGGRSEEPDAAVARRDGGHDGLRPRQAEDACARRASRRHHGVGRPVYESRSRAIITPAAWPTPCPVCWPRRHWRWWRHLRC